MTELLFKSRLYFVVVVSSTILGSLGLLVISKTYSYMDNRSLTDQQQPSFKSNENVELCSSDEFNKGKWVHQIIGLDSHTVEGINAYTGYYCNWDFPHRCYRRQEPLTEFNRSKAMLDYSWQPENCALIPFEARDFARHLSENPLLLVGDSITQLMFESLWCLTGQDLTNQNKDVQLAGGDTSMWVSQLVHWNRVNEDSAVTVAYIRSDYLVKLNDFSLIKPNEGEGYQIGIGNNFPWVHAIPRFKYIMINTGPHWHPDPKWGVNKNRAELLEAFRLAMRKVFDYLKKNLRSDQRVWVRSTPYGHAKCSQYTAPSIIPVEPTGQQGEYEWDMLKKFDFIWKDMIEKEKDDRFQFFNVSVLSNLRGDAHSQPDHDCLHTCLPGPVDDWNKFLYHEIIKNQQ
ncbi:MAG: GDSL/SGNH-like acyl-esterase family found in Pmr5 and Cas1p-domain-containing protein [Benjaminiella poitrasii]|nr:MAG: GDSL/SGNH-like acyl-esterase family found in Pmr5 and Cas1p-domain-containing protein [Benjaminiella poitrasii]